MGDRRAPPRELRGRALAGRLFELECEPAFDALELLPTIEGVREATLYGAVLHVLLDDALLSIEALLWRLREAGFQIGQVRPIQPSLEDVFVSLIRPQEG